MVLIQCPSKLTEEEEMLQKKYAKLKKKKRALQALRAPKPETAPVEEKKKKKSTDEAADATEKAKKLLKSGAIKVAVEKKDQQGFKRTKRQKETEKSAVGFTPFTSTQEYEDEKSDEPTNKKIKGLYDSFVGSRESGGESSDRDTEPKVRERETEFRDRDFKRRGRDRERERDPPKKGHTVYVFGHGISEDIVKKSFSNIGKIVNITAEAEKKCAFITYDKMESADEAIAQMDGSMVAGVQLKVSMARRQPTFEAITEPSSNSSWSTIAASQSQKGTSSYKDRRGLVTYEEDDNIF